MLEKMQALNNLRNCSTFHDFIFIHRGIRYPVNSLLVSTVSKVISQKSVSEFEIPPIDGPMEDFISLIYGQSVLITPINCRFFNCIARLLDIHDLVEKTNEIILKTNTLDNVINFAEQLLDCGLDASEEIDLIASNFTKIIENSFLKNCSPRLLTNIIQSPSFTGSGIHLVQFLGSMIQSDPLKYLQVSQYLISNGLDPIQAFTTLQPSFDLNKCKGLLTTLIPRMKATKEKTKYFIPKPGREFEGFFNYASQQIQTEYHGANIFFSITASSEKSETTAVTNLLHPEDKTTYFDPKGFSEEWIQIKLSSGQFEMTHYSFMSWKDANKGTCPESWILQGSANGSTWIELDRVEHDRSLLAPSAVSLFKVKSICPPLVYFKFIQLNTCSTRNKRFILSGLEIFGKYIN